MSSMVAARPGQLRAKALGRESWLKAESILLCVTTVIIAMRINVPHAIAGDLLAMALLPAWFTYVRRYAGAYLFMGICFLAAASGIVLTLWSSADHRIGLGAMLDNTLLIVGPAMSFGLLLWARHRLGESAVLVLFGVGLVLGVSHTTEFYSQQPWKFGYSTAATVLLLALAHLSRSLTVELVVVITLMLIAAATDSRTSFAVLLLIAALQIWQRRPRQKSYRGSALRALLGLGVGGALIYYIGQGLILAGYLGVKTQQRSLQQINASGSLILGGRPELGATLALMRDRIWGFGSGTYVNYHDLLVAKTGMAGLNYDPDNGYVEKFMFGLGYKLHSATGDLWARYGLVGIAIAIFILVMTMRKIGHSVTFSTASAALLYIGFWSMWNVFFSPWYSSLTMITLMLVLSVRLKDPEKLAEFSAKPLRVKLSRLTFPSRREAT